MVLQQEELIHAIFLEATKPDEQADGACKRLLDDEILLAPNLCCG